MIFNDYKFIINDIQPSIIERTIKNTKNKDRIQTLPHIIKKPITFLKETNNLRRYD